MKKVIFFILSYAISSGAYSHNLSHDSIRFSCPQWIEAESTVLPMSVVFYRDGKIDPLVNQSFILVSTEADIGQNSIRVRNGVGTLSLEINTQNSFEISLPELGMSQYVALRTNLPVLELEGTLDSSLRLTSDTVYRIIGDILIPDGVTLHASPGSIVLIAESGNILVEGNISLEGSKEQAVVFKSIKNNSYWGGIELINATDTSQFMYCFFLQGGNNPNKVFGHSNSQAVIMANRSNLDIYGSCFVDNPGKALGSKESYINITNCIIARCDTGGEFVNSVVSIANTSVLEIPDNDGIIDDDDNDGFYFSGVHPSNESSLITACIFTTGEDDGIDHNGAKIRVENCRIEDFYHEGIACSNNNWVEVFSTLIMNCDQGIEAGYGSPNVLVDHCVILNCNTGYRFGDSYDWGCSGKLIITNSIAHNNSDNFMNFDVSSGGKVENAIDVTFTITNDTEYDTYLGCISAVPEFDELFFLQAGSPGTGKGSDRTNLGLYQDKMQTEGIREYHITCDPAEFLMINQNYAEDIYIPVTITHLGITLDQARMRIRGDGTRVHPKKSLKVKLDYGSFPDGRSVLNFNAEYEDKSYIQQYIVSRLMRESGLPCFDSEHARVYLNGEYLGLYLLIENMDQDFLIRRSLDPEGNLYKASNDGASLSIYDNVYYHWEKKTGSGGRKDLQELINQINSVDQDQYQNFAQSSLAYGNMINILALNLLTR
ncbi:MAG: CotH kinase family protein, partial [Bacteroidota bacterium]|nr:CotH kinase family protein [Bacteroidota bacterium]